MESMHPEFACCVSQEAALVSWLNLVKGIKEVSEYAQFGSQILLSSGDMAGNLLWSSSMMMMMTHDEKSSIERDHKTRFARNNVLKYSESIHVSSNLLLAEICL